VTLSGLEELSLEACRALVAFELEQHAPHVAADARRELAARTSYVRFDALEGAIAGEPVLVYAATPPAAVPAVVEALRRAEIDAASRIVLDKPLGLDRASARSLNEALAGVVGSRNVFRIDHFLYHRAVQELVRWRVAHPGLLGAAHVEIVWDETRPAASPYIGVLRDMVQSHLLQLAALVTMEPPRSLARDELGQRRLDALRRLEAVGDERVGETLAELTLRAQDGTSLRLRAAKGAQSSRRQIELRFGEGFMRLEVLAGKLTVAPAGAPPSTVDLFDGTHPEPPSVRLLRDALAGDDTFTLLPEEPEECWRIVEPVLAAEAHGG
jgi:glucose-6-phosphate 1-dehydrogenase